MRSPTNPWLIQLLLCSHLIAALITLDTMRNLTAITDECRERIVAGDDGGKLGMEIPGQVVLLGERDGGEVEDVSLRFVFFSSRERRELSVDHVGEAWRRRRGTSRSGPTDIARRGETDSVSISLMGLGLMQYFHRLLRLL